METFRSQHRERTPATIAYSAELLEQARKLAIKFGELNGGVKKLIVWGGVADEKAIPESDNVPGSDLDMVWITDNNEYQDFRVGMLQAMKRIAEADGFNVEPYDIPGKVRVDLQWLPVSLFENPESTEFDLPDEGRPVVRRMRDIHEVVFERN